MDIGKALDLLAWPLIIFIIIILFIILFRKSISQKISSLEIIKYKQFEAKFRNIEPDLIKEKEDIEKKTKNIYSHIANGGLVLKGQANHELVTKQPDDSNGMARPSSSDTIIDAWMKLEKMIWTLFQMLPELSGYSPQTIVDVLALMESKEIVKKPFIDFIHSLHKIRNVYIHSHDYTNLPSEAFVLKYAKATELIFDYLRSIKNYDNSKRISAQLNIPAN
jgi:hypothetical protein